VKGGGDKFVRAKAYAKPTFYVAATVMPVSKPTRTTRNCHVLSV